MVRSHVVQYLYPQAHPRPLAYVPPGQAYSGARTVGGTFTLVSTLLKDVTGLDLGAAQPSVAPAPPPPAPGPSADPMVLAGAGALTVALIGVVAIAWRRRHDAAASHVPG